MYSKKDLTERDICTKFITPALERSGWDIQLQVLEEFAFTHGRIYVKGKLTALGEQKRADLYLFLQTQSPRCHYQGKRQPPPRSRSWNAARIEVCENPAYALCFQFKRGWLIFHDRTIKEGLIEKDRSLDEFPTPEQLWLRYKFYKGLDTTEEERIAAQDYFNDGSGRTPRVTLAKIQNALIPLPAIKEQKLIVAKLEKLMHHCDELEQSIKQSQTQNEQLLQKYCAKRCSLG